ncbi:phage tail assembly protein [Limimaricola variabilis]|uniref:phage tail assembly protein n=1 Tax=Limimaricola variabilis TaxID=1492771 RepID=UPI002AC8FF0A|nr:phage tail assembly protein [Limimaricola variabilis]WPY95591.1 phage tail assembly protein [Limimaricola variabilis]
MDRKLPDYIVEGADGALSVTLARGIEVAGATVKKLQLREPTLADQLAAQAGKNGTAESEVALLANLAEITPDELRHVKMRDYARLQVALGFFYG